MKRRHFIQAGAAVALCGTAAGATGLEANEPLLELGRLLAQHDQAYAQLRRDPTEDEERHFLNVWEELMDRVMATPANTLAGLTIKARLVLAEVVIAQSSALGDDLAWSTLKDLERLAPAPRDAMPWELARMMRLRSI